MSQSLTLLTPLLVLLIVIGFGFVGCSSFTEEKAVVDPYKTSIAKTPGFAAQWPLDETSGSVAFVSGSLAPVANGVYKLEGVTLGQPGPLTAIDAKNFAPRFNGVNGFVEVPYDARLNPVNSLKFSVELWVKPDAAASASPQVLVSSHQFGNARQRGYEIALLRLPGEARPSIRGRVFAESPSEVVVTPTQGDAAAWRHVVLTYDGAGGAGGKVLTVYVSVVGIVNPFVGTRPASPYQSVQNGESTLRFGAGHDADGAAVQAFGGWLDEVAFYNAALAVTEVQAHFKLAGNKA